MLTQGVNCFLFFFCEATHGSKRVPSQSGQSTIKGVDLLSVHHVAQVGVPMCVCVCGWSRLDGSGVDCAPEGGGSVRAA